MTKELDILEKSTTSKQFNYTLEQNALSFDILGYYSPVHTVSEGRVSVTKVFLSNIGYMNKFCLCVQISIRQKVFCLILDT